MHFLFLNQYFPPDPAPTGILLRELADDLVKRGHTVDFVAARESYRAGQARGGRMLRELRALGRMLLDGARRRPRPEVIFSASSPPILLVVATLLAWWHRARSVHWIMDLYPEIAVALGEIRGGALAGIIRKMMGYGYRQAEHVVALDADMAACVRHHGVEAVIIRPWVFASVLARPLPDVEPVTPWTWIYSGNLGRAHEWETLLQVQRLIEERDPEMRLLFQGGGPSWPLAKARAEALGLRRCQWQPYVAEEALPAALLSAQVCVVSQRPEVQGCLWPSKLGFLLTLPRPILWVGPIDGAIARDLASRVHTGIFAPGEADAIADWLLAQKRRGTSAESPTLDATAHRAEALRAWQTLLDPAQ